MFRNYFKTAWRNLWKNSFFSLLNIFGLAVGIAACIMIMLFVFYEKSFDARHTKNIYRLDEVQKFEGMVAPQKVALSMYPMAPTLKQDFPEVKSYVRLNSWNNIELVNEGKKHNVPKLMFADSNFFNFFDFRLTKGDKLQVLDKPNSVVLSEDLAKRIYGTADPIGQTVSFYGNDTILFKVTGLMANVPGNSHLQFDGVFSFSTISNPRNMENWGGNWLTTYLELAPGANIAAMEKKFPAYLKSHMSGDGWKFYELFLQKLSDIHAGSMDITHDYHNFLKFDKRYTYIFSIIGILVLVIACINFMNLATAKSAGRAREVGVRKSIGAGRFQLAIQFIGESILVCLLALVLAIIFVKLCLPFVRNLSERDLQFPLFSNPVMLLIILSGTLITGLVAGIYPSIYLSSFKPAKVLKGSVQSGKAKSFFRNALVVTQFTASVFLIIATVFAVRQLNFMQEKDPGFSRDQVVLLRLNNKTNPRYNAIKEALLTHPGVLAVSGSQQRLGNNLHQTGVTYHGGKGAREMATSQNVVDPDYLRLYKIRIIAGRDFSNDYDSENGKGYIINESLAEELLKDEPKGSKPQVLIGKRFGFGGMDSVGRIIGVAKNFNFNSLHHKIETLCMISQKDWGYSEISVRLDSKNAVKAMDDVKKVWAGLVPDFPIDYKFLDDHFAELYKADKQVSEVVAILASLAIVISCLGLFGLASFSAEKRVKEIGIRKVLGASVNSIVNMLSVDFVKLVIISNLIAWPIAWFALNKWLNDFAYRVEINWLVFVLAGLASLIIAVLTVCFQAIKASLANPVKSLKMD
ncbi:MAG: ABC transporter permease [Flavitalea sp.]